MEKLSALSLHKKAGSVECLQHRSMIPKSIMPIANESANETYLFNS